MKKYKISVYAISKNEEKHAKRWVKSMKEADSINVLDTGSTDKTVKILKKLGVNVVEKKIEPFRFDVARNESLKIIPFDTDICVCTDLDEVFEKGWRKKLEKAWEKDTTLGIYTLNSTLDEEQKPLVSFYINKIHDLKNYKWIYPVHEVLSFIGQKENKINLDITLNHLPDKTKTRSYYFDLLKLAVDEEPTNDRNWHYLGREYMYKGLWKEAIDTLLQHLKLSSWKEERSASMRFISRCYLNLDKKDEARIWLNNSIKETPNLRDPYVELAYLEYNEKNYQESVKLLQKALLIENNPKTYINESFSYNYFIYDILSICEYYLGNYIDAINYVKKAISMEPNNKRLKKNLNLMKKSLNG